MKYDLHYVHIIQLLSIYALILTHTHTDKQFFFSFFLYFLRNFLFLFFLVYFPCTHHKLFRIYILFFVVLKRLYAARLPVRQTTICVDDSERAKKIAMKYWAECTSKRPAYTQTHAHTKTVGFLSVHQQPEHQQKTAPFCSCACFLSYSYSPCIRALLIANTPKNYGKRLQINEQKRNVLSSFFPFFSTFLNFTNKFMTLFCCCC